MKRLIQYCIRWLLIVLLLFFSCENYLQENYLFVPSSTREFVLKESDDPAVLQGWMNQSCTADVSLDDAAVLETTDEDCKRVTPLVESPETYAAFLGDSYTYGMGVPDNENFVWRIAEQLPYVQFDNYAVSGYGTQQCSTWLAHLNYEWQHGKKNIHYDKIFYVFIGDHLNRNYEFRFNKKNDGNIVVLPRAEENNGIILYHGLETLYWPLSDQFASVVFFRNLYANYLLLYYKSISHYSFINQEQNVEEGKIAVFNGIIADMLRTSKNYGAEFYVLYLDCNVDNILSPNLKASGLNTIDMVYEGIRSNKSRVRNLPDHHPNAEVHKYWADSFVKQMKDKF